MPTRKRSVYYRYWNMMRNCGDAVSAYIFDRVFDLEPVFAGNEAPYLSAVGSIIGFANTNTYIWGSGVLSAKWKVPQLDTSRIRALRGHLTRAHLRSLGYRVGDIPLGDPGIFAADVLKHELPSLPILYRAAVVPHHSAINAPIFDQYRSSSEFCVVNMIDDTINPLRQIAMSETVISQSLHGLIFAESLGRPSVWIAHTDSEDWCFKFRDWYSTT